MHMEIFERGGVVHPPPWDCMEREEDAMLE
jgi:hypothetical protein